MRLESVVANLVEKVERRFFGKYRGFVVDNADPERLGRLKLRVPSVCGPDVVTGWAMPCVPYGGDADQGFLFIPEVAAGVWVEFEEGDLEFPIWVGTFWSKPGGESEAPRPVESDAVQDPPTRKILKTKKGHTIELEDKDDEEKITIKHKAGSMVSIDKEGSVIIGNQNGSTFILNAKDENVMLLEQHGHLIAMSADGVVISNTEGAFVELKGKKAKVVAEEGLQVSAKSITVDGGSIALGANATDPVILGNLFMALYNAHTHPTAMGPSGPPLPPLTPAQMSLGVKAK